MGTSHADAVYGGHVGHRARLVSHDVVYFIVGVILELFVTY